ncbi:chaperonin 10-like protein [Favolaschia claudopus]|uniref:Chaperonin 10-like protein n=1 Tax=Favolaschia claudopus TaxID=2862362 RepID=A0AAW0CN71_9AGAR
MSTTTTNKAAWLLTPKTTPLEIAPAPLPTPHKTEVVVQVHSVAINPADAAIQHLGVVLDAEHYPYILGFDIAGVVTAVGPSNKRFQPGDRVTALGIAYALRDTRYGAFQHYAVVDEPVLAKIPDSLGFNDACVLGAGLSTAADALFNRNAMALDFPKPGGNKPNGKTLLVWGGASSVGACAIQAAKAAGYTIAATASARNFDLLREIGAEYVFDYTSATVIEDVVDALKDKVEMAGIFCAIIDPAVLTQCAAISARLGGRKHVGTVRPPGFPPLENWPQDIEVSECNCCDVAKNEVGPKVWGSWLEAALADGSMKCRPRCEVVGKGLEGLQGALDLMFKGVSAKKLVVEIV